MKRINPYPFLSRKLVMFLTVLFFAGNVIAQDLPSPSANLQTLPTGSYVIAMDNTYQLNSGSLFNLKTYGLIVHLLNNNIKLKWVIKAGKAKDGIDFTVTSHQVYPTTIAGAVSRSFKGGPLVIFPADTNGVAALVNAFYTTNSITGNNRPKIFVTEASSTVDIRYDLSGTKPKAAILNDGGNENIHEAFFTAASIPAASYSISFGKDLISGCYTFASEPHNDKTGLIVDSAIIGIKNFVVNGGNFLAQCAAVTNYENSTYGHFQTSTGITTSYINLGSTLGYSNPDLSYSQFEGGFDGGNGVVEKWTVNTTGINSVHNHITGIGANSSIIAASVAKFSSTYNGGLVFYLGMHDFRTNRADEVNGIRMYMNAFLTPSILSCSMSLLPFQYNQFTGSSIGQSAELKWKVTSNEAIDHFELLQSADGNKFRNIGTIASTKRSGFNEYSYLDSTSSSKSSVYYRLKIVRYGGSVSYSNTILIKQENIKTDKLVVLENPVYQKLSFNYFANDNGPREIKIFNSNGLKLSSVTINATKGNNSYSILLDSKLPTGIYFLSLTTKEENIISKFMKR